MLIILYYPSLNILGRYVIAGMYSILGELTNEHWYTCLKNVGILKYIVVMVLRYSLLYRDARWLCIWVRRWQRIHTSRCWCCQIWSWFKRWDKTTKTKSKTQPTACMSTFPLLPSNLL
jgi:hypothetical protein